jgi:phosphoheptose isomerase
VGIIAPVDVLRFYVDHIRRGRRRPGERQARASLRDASKSLARTERACVRAVAAAAEVVIACLEGGGTVFFCGNGGSAADAQHIAAEMVGRFMGERRGMPAIALTTDTSALTAIANDYGYDAVFARQSRRSAAPATSPSRSRRAASPRTC